MDVREREGCLLWAARLQTTPRLRRAQKVQVSVDADVSPCWCLVPFAALPQTVPKTLVLPGPDLQLPQAAETHSCPSRGHWAAQAVRLPPSLSASSLLTCRCSRLLGDCTCQHPQTKALLAHNGNRGSAGQRHSALGAAFVVLSLGAALQPPPTPSFQPCSFRVSQDCGLTDNSCSKTRWVFQVCAHVCYTHFPGDLSVA